MATLVFKQTKNLEMLKMEPGTPQNSEISGEKYKNQKFLQVNCKKNQKFPQGTLEKYFKYTLSWRRTVGKEAKGKTGVEDSSLNLTWDTIH